MEPPTQPSLVVELINVINQPGQIDLRDSPPFPYLECKIQNMRPSFSPTLILIFLKETFNDLNVKTWKKHFSKCHFE